MMTESKALMIVENFIDYLIEMKDVTEFSTDEDIEALQYLLDTYNHKN